jgi:RHH-type rel operon transcriptional repressor/antitoxin RelB
MLYLYSLLKELPKMLAIRLPKDIEDRLEALARQTGRTKTYYARQAILEYLDDLEDYYLAVARLEENLPTIALEDVERQLGLAD